MGVLRGLEEKALPLTEGVLGNGLTLGDTHRKRDQRQARWAREVFHAVLAIDLKARGAATAEQLYHRLSWFMLPFERSEVLQILDSARRSGVIERLGDARDALGGEVSEEWFPTEEGMKLKRPRSLSLPDLGRSVVGSSAGFSTVFTSTKEVLLALVSVLALAGTNVKFVSDQDWVLMLASAMALIAALVDGILGDLKLRAAVRSWPRMREKRRARHAYQLSRQRLVFLPAVVIGFYLIIAVGILLPVSWLKAGIGSVVLLLLAAAFYRFSLRGLRKAWSGDDKDLLAWEWAWLLRKPIPRSRLAGTTGSRAEATSSSART
jgi:hypothetical protein